MTKLMSIYMLGECGVFGVGELCGALEYMSQSSSLVNSENLLVDLT